MVVAVLGIVNPYMLKLIIDDAILKHNPRLLLIFFGIMVITPVVSTGLGVWQTYLNAVVGQRMMQDLRVALYTHLQNLPPRLLHGDPDRRDPVPPGQRRGWGGLGDHQHRDQHRSQPDPHRGHPGRHGLPQLAADGCSRSRCCRSSFW